MGTEFNCKHTTEVWFTRFGRVTESGSRPIYSYGLGLRVRLTLPVNGDWTRSRQTATLPVRYTYVVHPQPNEILTSWIQVWCGGRTSRGAAVMVVMIKFGGFALVVRSVDGFGGGGGSSDGSRWVGGSLLLLRFMSSLSLSQPVRRIPSTGYKLDQRIYI